MSEWSIYTLHTSAVCIQIIVEKQRETHHENGHSFMCKWHANTFSGSIVLWNSPVYLHFIKVNFLVQILRRPCPRCLSSWSERKRERELRSLLLYICPWWYLSCSHYKERQESDCFRYNICICQCLAQGRDMPGMCRFRIRMTLI